MRNWKFFKALLLGYTKYFNPPTVKILPERNDYLKSYPDAWAYYEPNERTMYILQEHDSIAVRAHEYGHWLNACIYFILEIIWEFFWWGLGLRSVVKVMGGKIRR